MSAVLITGAAGFVGSHLIELLENEVRLKPDGWPIIHHEPDGSPRNIVAWLRPGTEPLVSGSRVIWHAIELHDRKAVVDAMAAFRPDAIYHLAGVPHVGDSWAHVHETFAGNVLGTHHLFEALRHVRITPRVLISSTAFVYAPVDRALTEHDTVRPNSPYGTSKLAQEMLGVRAWEDDGIPVLIARAFNHAGPRQAPSFVASSVARQIAEIEKGLRPPTLAMGNLDSQRDVMDVRDTVRAYQAMMAAATPGIPYNVCSGTALPVRTLVELMRSKAGVPVTIEQDPARFRPNDTPLVLGDHSRLTRDTGWQPQIPVERTVEDLLAYWRQQVA
jgi:GDP-4-dehydro-6-deoxy-D-mannose reductase